MKHLPATAPRDALLDEVLSLVPFEGWNVRCLELAASRLKLDAIILFPNGVSDVIAYYSRSMDRRMLETLAQHDLASMKIRQRIAFAVRTRLEIIAAYKEAERRALAYLANPLHATLGLELLYHTVDDMWHCAGDTSTDFNFYTKRLLLAKVVTSTLLYWLNDESPEHTKSWEFLDRRIDNVMQIQKWKGQAQAWLTQKWPDFQRSAWK
ncbi:MAG: COQ9 family protein [Rickettsiales bacterium]|nr:COQ9 family protein [Rickettsiales bacterium]